MHYDIFVKLSNGMLYNVIHSLTITEGHISALEIEREEKEIKKRAEMQTPITAR